MEAMISGSAGLALLMDGEQLFSIHVDEPEQIVPRHPAEFHYLAGNARDFIIVEVETRDELVSELLLARDCEDALHLVLIAQDVKLSDGVRREAIEELEELLQDGNVGAFLENVLYSHPLPETIDLTGALQRARDAEAREVQALLELCWTHQDEIRNVRTAWESIPLSEFEGEDDHWRATAVRGGAFRDLVRCRERGQSLAGVFARLSAQSTISALPNSRSVLQRWLSSLRRLREVSESKAVETASVVCEPQTEYGSESQILQKRAAIAEAMERQDFHQARKYIEELVEEHREQAETYSGLCDLGMLAKRLGSLDLYLKITEICVNLRPTEGLAWSQYGSALLHNQREEEALKAYDHAERCGNPVEASIDRAATLKDVKRLSEALQAYNLAIEKYPEEVDAKIGRAEVLRELNRLEESLEAYNYAIATHPRSGLAKTGRAEVLKALGRPNEARHELNQLRTSYHEDLIRLFELRKRKIEQEMSPAAFLKGQLSPSEIHEMRAYFRSLEPNEGRAQEGALLDLAILKYLLNNGEK